MTAIVRFYFDYASPTSYLAWARLPQLAARTGAQIESVPVLLGGIFKATGNSPPLSVPAKLKWLLDDLQLWARQEDISFAMNPHFPINSLKLMRGAALAQVRGELTPYSKAVFEGMWRDGRNLGQADEVAAVLALSGLDAQAYAAGIDDPQIKARLVENTEAAVAAGAFGVPTLIVGERLFFGQDRLAFVEAELKALS